MFKKKKNNEYLIENGVEVVNFGSPKLLLNYCDNSKQNVYSTCFAAVKNNDFLVITHFPAD